ncbi:MAG TPA: hypothetical protein VLB27_01185, partial [candidate division Zixibacteria bacterium]|nr:hypothetical protein [candidate division Zixibacteria bacterium]
MRRKFHTVLRGHLSARIARTTFVALSTAALTLSATAAHAQNFDFKRLQSQAEQFTVIVKATVSMSMGSEPFESKIRGLGLVVRDDGLVMIDATLVDFGSGMSAYYGSAAGFDVFNMTVEFLDGREFSAEWLGADPFNGLGFLKVTNGDHQFKTVEFADRSDFRVGEWVSLFYLLPENVSPPLGADVGMITALLEEPEKAPL